MVNESNEISRNDVLYANQEFYGPEYDSVADAPDVDGLVFWVNGSGADPAGYYARASNSVSGPFGGPSNLPDTDLGGSTVANTETYGFEQHLTAAEDASDPKRVNLDVDTTNLDTRYLKNYEDDFELSDPTDPTVDQPSTPGGFRFEAGSASAAVPGGYYYSDTPDGITSTRSFGCDFESATAPDGSTIQSSTWALAQEFAVGAGGHDLTVSAYARPTADYASYDDGNTHADTETFVGADDAFVEIQCYDASLQPLALDTTTQYSDTASEQHFAAGNTSSLSGSTWVTLEHTATLPADTAYVEVRLQAADAGDMWATRGDTGTGHAAILFDAFEARYTAGLRRSGVLGHDHDTQYAPLSHASATDNPHDVTATQAGALADTSGSVSEGNLGFDTATQSELDGHTGDSSNPHGVTAAEAGALAEDVSQINVRNAGSVAQADNAAALGGDPADEYPKQVPPDRITYNDENGDGTRHQIRINNATEFLRAGGGAGNGTAHFEIAASNVRNYSGGAGQLSSIHADMFVQKVGGDYHDQTSAYYASGCEIAYANFNSGDIRFAYDTPTYRSRPDITVKLL